MDLRICDIFTEILIVSPKNPVGAPENANHSTWDWRLRRKRFIYYLAFIKLKFIGFSLKKHATSPHSVLKCEYQYGSTTVPICHPINLSKLLRPCQRLKGAAYA